MKSHLESFALLWSCDGAPMDPARLTCLQRNLSPAQPEVWHSCQQDAVGLIATREPHLENNVILAARARLDNRRELALLLGVAVPEDDRQLLLAAWRRWGRDCAQYLIGDFAFVLVDQARQELFAARDAMGIVPLYYTFIPHKLMAVSTSSRALSNLPHVAGQLDEDGLMMWLQFQYDDRLTLFKGIHGLDWGECLYGRAARLKVSRYWRLQEVKPLNYGHQDDYVQHYLEVFDRSVADRCVNETGVVGSMLSGGMDSSSVTASAAKAAKVQGFCLKPFSMRFNQLKDCDESTQSADAAMQLGLTPQWLEAEQHWLFKGSLGRNTIPDIPFLTWDSMEHHMLEQLADMGGKVLLTGHGGDNLTAGVNPRHLVGARLRAGHWKALTQLKDQFGMTTRAALWRYVVSTLLPETWAQAIWPRGITKPFPWIQEQRHEHWNRLQAQLARKPRFYAQPDRQGAFEFMVCGGAGVRRIAHYYHELAANYGIEVRHPFFDRRLVELVLSFPCELMRLHEKPKGFVRYAMRERLPQSILANLHKPLLMYFYRWGLHKEKNNVECLLGKSRLADLGFIDVEALLQCLNAYLDDSTDSTVPMFLTAIMIENRLLGMN